MIKQYSQVNSIKSVVLSVQRDSDEWAASNLRTPTVHATTSCQLPVQPDTLRLFEKTHQWNTQLKQKNASADIKENIVKHRTARKYREQKNSSEYNVKKWTLQLKMTL